VISLAAVSVVRDPMGTDLNDPAHAGA